MARPGTRFQRLPKPTATHQLRPVPSVWTRCKRFSSRPGKGCGLTVRSRRPGKLPCPGHLLDHPPPPQALAATPSRSAAPLLSRVQRAPSASAPARAAARRARPAAASVCPPGHDPPSPSPPLPPTGRARAAPSGRFRPRDGRKAIGRVTGWPRPATRSAAPLRRPGSASRPENPTAG